MELLTVWGHGQDLPRIPLKRGVSRSVGFGRLGTRGALSGAATDACPYDPPPPSAAYLRLRSKTPVFQP